MIAEGDISNLAGRMPLGESQEPDESGSSEELRVRRWSPFWATIFVFGAGLATWGAIAAIAVSAADELIDLFEVVLCY